MLRRERSPFVSGVLRMEFSFVFICRVNDEENPALVIKPPGTAHNGQQQASPLQDEASTAKRWTEI